MEEPQLAIESASVMLKSEMEELAYNLEKQCEVYALLSGTCSLCKRCNCTPGLLCKNLDRMRYSMEATGLDVSGLMKDKMNMPLLGYNNKTLPKYQ